MLLLIVLTLIFIAIIGMIIYANWPAGDLSRDRCGCGGLDDQCPRCPCKRCGQPKSDCRCPHRKQGCPFC